MTDHVPISLPPGQVDQSASLAAPAEVGQAGGTRKRGHPKGCDCVTCEVPFRQVDQVEDAALPAQVPPSDTLWRFLTGGYTRSFIVGLGISERDKQALLSRAQRNWDQIRTELGQCL